MINNMNDLFKDDPKYLEGIENWFIRAYYYCSNGLTILNEFRNLFLGILGLYIALKWDNILGAVLLFMVCVIILTIVGYYTVHKVSKVREFLGMRFGSHFGKKSFDYQEASYELLVEIRDLLKKLS